MLVGHALARRGNARRVIGVNVTFEYDGDFDSYLTVQGFGPFRYPRVAGGLAGSQQALSNDLDLVLFAPWARPASS
jgi:hypothetical protein